MHQIPFDYNAPINTLNSLKQNLKKIPSSAIISTVSNNSVRNNIRKVTNRYKLLETQHRTNFLQAKIKSFFCRPLRKKVVTFNSQKMNFITSWMLFPEC